MEECTCRGGPHGGYTCPRCRGGLVRDVFFDSDQEERLTIIFTRPKKKTFEFSEEQLNDIAEEMGGGTYTSEG